MAYRKLQDTPTTTLQAVNLMLQSVSIATVSTLDPTSTDESVQKAFNTLSAVNVRVQSEGWHCNKEYDYPMTPDAATGEIVLPPNASFKGLADRSSMREAAMRGGKLYDLHNHTFAWINGTNGTETAKLPLNGPLHINIQLTLDFEDLPNSLRWRILCEAAREFAVGRNPDQATFRFTDTIYEESLVWAEQDDTDQQSSRVVRNPHFRKAMRR